MCRKEEEEMIEKMERREGVYVERNKRKKIKRKIEGICRKKEKERMKRM